VNIAQKLIFCPYRPLSEFQSYFQPLINAMRNPRTIMSSASSAAGTATPEGILSNIRNLDRKQLASIGIVFAEVLGFFTVGTMIGRMKVVGYHGEVHHEH
jgi:F-type H+-transporting ATPase subunit g